MFVQVIVNRPTHHRPPPGAEPVRGDDTWLASYTYRLPEHLRDTAAIGHLVQVPLGTGNALGVVSALFDTLPGDLPPGTTIRDIASIVDPLPVVTPAQIELAHWISHHYLAPLNQAIRLVLPPDLEARTYVVVSQADRQAAGNDLSQDERTALRLLERRGGRLRASALLEKIPAQDPDLVLHSLVERGLVESSYTLVPPKPAPPRIQYVRLLADDATIDAALPRLGRSSKQADVLWILARRVDAPLTLRELCTSADCSDGPVRALARQGWVEIADRQTWLVALPGAESADLGRAHKQAEALSALLAHGGSAEMAGFLERTETSSAIIAALERRGLVQRVTQDPVVLLTLAPEQVLERVVELRGAGEERAVLDLLRGSTGRVWVGGIYAQTGADLGTLRKLAARGLISLHVEEYERPRPLGQDLPPHLTGDQQATWQVIEEGLQQSSPFVALLHGVTGSGKTEIYMRAVAATLAAGRRAIVLVPEISLTAQTVRRLEARFPGQVAVMHSQLSLGQRYAVWNRVRGGEADVLIGPRGALFAPMARLGLIVLDEAHDGSYKQSEPIPLPAYHARDVAIAFGRLTGCSVILGSATPDLETYYEAEQGTYRLLELSQRILTPVRAAGLRTQPEGGRGWHSDLPPVRIVDLRQELRAGNRSIFSRALQDALRRALARGEQAILFLNRRGAATFVLCRDCGHIARCPNCEIPLTYHNPLASRGKVPVAEWLICHRCNHREPNPDRCPACGGQRIRHFGLGTQRVEETVHKLLPGARLLRWDRDTASGLDHERFLQDFLEHRADVLIGTQMIAKGLDLPLVTLVGVISADTALHMPDFRAAERTFQLLSQVAGRAGRSRLGGSVIVQSYTPDHYAIEAASRHDYAGFYRQELAYRNQLGYPPFARLLALRYTDEDPYRCQREARRLGRWLAAEIQRTGLAATLIGPAPCFFSRVQGRYRWQILVRGSDPVPLLQNVALPRGWLVDVDPIDLL